MFRDVGPVVYGRVPAPFGATPHLARRWASGHIEILTGSDEWMTLDYPADHSKFVPDDAPRSCPTRQL